MMDMKPTFYHICEPVSPTWSTFVDRARHDIDIYNAALIESRMGDVNSRHA